MEKGKLIFKVVGYEEKLFKKHFNTPSMILSFVALCVIFSVALIFLTDKMYNPYNEDENTMYYILLIIIGGILSTGFVKRSSTRALLKDSYLYIYENRVEGMSEIKSSMFKSSLERFSISLDDIINISYSEQYIVIYTNWQTYKIFAFQKENEIIRIINELKNIATGESKSPHQKEFTTLHSWTCPNCEEINKSNSRICIKCGTTKKLKSEDLNTVNVPLNKPSTSPSTSQPSHKCTCGERFYGEMCPNCGRLFK